MWDRGGNWEVWMEEIYTEVGIGNEGNTDGWDSARNVWKG